MIDNFAILFSTVMVMFIVIRAARMDRVRPWFETRSLYEQEQRREADRQAKRRAKVQLPMPDAFSGVSPKRR